MRLLNHRTTSIRREEKPLGAKARPDLLPGGRQELLPGFRPYLNYKSPLRCYAYNKSGKRGLRADQVTGGMNRNTFHQVAPAVSHLSPLEHSANPILSGEMRNQALKMSGASNWHSQASDAAIEGRPFAHPHENGMRLPAPLPLQHLGSLGHRLNSQSSSPGQTPHSGSGGAPMEFPRQSNPDNPPMGSATRADMAATLPDSVPTSIPADPLAYPASNSQIRLHFSPRAGAHLPNGARNCDLPGKAHPDKAADALEFRRSIHPIAIIDIQGTSPGGLAANSHGIAFPNSGRAQGRRNECPGAFPYLAIMPVTTMSHQAAHPAGSPGTAHSAHYPQPGSPSAGHPPHSVNLHNAGTAAPVPGSRPRRAAQLIVARAGNPPPE